MLTINLDCPLERGWGLATLSPPSQPSVWSAAARRCQLKTRRRVCALQIERSHACALQIKNRQSGATLITALIMLIVLTLLVVSGIRASNTNLRIVGNMQMQEEAVAAAQQAIEKVISSSVWDIAAQTVGDYNVTFSPLSCLSAKVAASADPGVTWQCQGSAGSVQCYWTTWEITATAINTSSGATAVVHQGVSKLAGSTEANASCVIS